MQSVRVRLRKKSGKGWAYQEIEVPTDAEMERIAAELHEKHVPALTSCLGWKVFYNPAHPVRYSTVPVNPFTGESGQSSQHHTSTISYCVFGHGAEWQVCYAWNRGDIAPPVRIQEKGDVVPVPTESQQNLILDEVPVVGKEVYIEGAIKRVELSTHERNPNARKECIDHYGAKCVVCGFDFGKMYGEIAEGFIHVHHLAPLAESSGEHEVDFVQDLRPVCPNCHAALHMRKPSFGIEELQRLVCRSSSAEPGVSPNFGPAHEFEHLATGTGPQSVS